MIVALLFTMDFIVTSDFLLLLLFFFIFHSRFINLTVNWSSLQNSKFTTRRWRGKKCARFYWLETWTDHDHHHDPLPCWMNEWKLTFVILIVRGGFVFYSNGDFPRMNWTSFSPIRCRLWSVCQLGCENRIVAKCLNSSLCCSHNTSTINVSLTIDLCFPMLVFWEFHLIVTSFCACLTCEHRTLFFGSCAAFHTSMLVFLSLWHSIDVHFKSMELVMISTVFMK